jgi:hypothetical protein
LRKPGFELKAVDEPKAATVFHANATVEGRGTLFKTVIAEARTPVMHLAQSTSNSIEDVNVDVFTANLVKAEASIFDLNLGIGVDTGFSIKDDCVGAKFAGCGFEIGRKVSISAFGSGFGIDFGRLFG